MSSVNKEDYLRIMYKYHERGKQIRITDIANELEISKPSVTEMMSKLSSEGFIVHKKYSTPKLTKKGYDLSKQLTRNHRIIEYFLVEKLKFKDDEIHEEANKLEHAFSDKAIEKLYDFIGQPNKDPHGEIIP
jgi:DtxR family transcriptional regulator, Mn-dependent transcriptional regulator